MVHQEWSWSYKVDFMIKIEKNDEKSYGFISSTNKLLTINIYQ